ncbi:MAG TPA: pirin family protein [Candidatus Deferrimicrobiaceae bacterium]|nr:pirin family protein [Candidatus Deferrimicrobiaceae bacterium]
MTVVRTIRKVWRAKPTIEGAGVHLKRVFGYQEVPQLDPFLLLDDFRSEDPSKYLPGFPWHPHRGIETITYVLRGDVEHGDSLGNKGDITSGDVQWMTAGSGIIHQEMPKGDVKGRMGGGPAMGQSSRFPQDDGPEVPGREAQPDTGGGPGGRCEG